MFSTLRISRVIFPLLHYRKILFLIWRFIFTLLLDCEEYWCSNIVIMVRIWKKNEIIEEICFTDGFLENCEKRTTQSAVLSIDFFTLLSSNSILHPKTHKWTQFVPFQTISNSEIQTNFSTIKSHSSDKTAD